METAFIEFLDGLYYPGYAACFVDENPEAYYRQRLNSKTFINPVLKTHLYLSMRIEVETELNLLDCVKEFENGVAVSITDTPNVRVLEQEVFLSVLPNTKN